MKGRLVFVDLLRGWATIVMIEVHVFNAFLVGPIKATSWYGWVDYVNGLVAPSFLFVAGFVFVIASDRKLEEFRTLGRAYRRQLGRIVLIWVIGYGLHLPFFSLTRTIRDTPPEKWLEFFQSDILHCIAIGMLIVFLGRIFIKRDRYYQWFIAVVGSVTVLAAPLIWDIDFTTVLPGVLAAYLNGQHYSIFPLFPWLGFLMFGAVTAFAYKNARAMGKEAEYFQRLTITGAVLLVGGSLISEVPLHVQGVSTSVRANPLFFASRLGIILLLLTACWYYAERRKTERSFVLDVSKESLLVYTAHLLVIYGRFWDGSSLAYRYRETFSLVQGILATLGLMLLMVLAAKGWSRLKQKSMPWARFISYATGIIVLIAFVVRKGY